MGDATKVRLDRERKTLYVSSIFKWFKEDFGDVAQFTSRFLPAEDARFVREQKVRLRYLKYDWSLNDRG